MYHSNTNDKVCSINSISVSVSGYLHNQILTVTEGILRILLEVLIISF